MTQGNYLLILLSLRKIIFNYLGHLLIMLLTPRECSGNTCKEAQRSKIQTLHNIEDGKDNTTQHHHIITEHNIT